VKNNANAATPNTVNANRKFNDFFRQSSLYLNGSKYAAKVTKAYNTTEKILFDVQ